MKSLVAPGTVSGTRSRKARAVAVLAGVLLTGAGSAIAFQPAQADAYAAPGANGSVKIDGTPVDDGPSNEPHVNCEFSVQYFGFDPGTNQATNVFRAWPPTGNQQTLVPTEGDLAFSFQGGAPGNTLDHTEKYKLDTTGITPNNKGEIHVRLDANVIDSGGKTFKKHKTFWLKPCSVTPPPTTPPPTTPPPTTPPPTTAPPTTPPPTTAPPTNGPTHFPGGESLASSTGNGGGTPGSGSSLPGWVLMFVGLAVGIVGATGTIVARRGRRRVT